MMTLSLWDPSFVRKHKSAHQKIEENLGQGSASEQVPFHYLFINIYVCYMVMCFVFLSMKDCRKGAFVILCRLNCYHIQFRLLYFVVAFALSLYFDFLFVLLFIYYSQFSKVWICPSNRPRLPTSHSRQPSLPRAARLWSVVWNH